MDFENALLFKVSGIFIMVFHSAPTTVENISKEFITDSNLKFKSQIAFIPFKSNNFKRCG